jgi:hypothetical protein
MMGGGSRFRAMATLCAEPGKFYASRVYLKRLPSPSHARDRLVRVTSEDIRNRQWTKPEIDAVRRASEAQAAGFDLSEEEHEDIPRLTAEQLARMVRLRDVRRKGCGERAARSAGA